MKDIIDVLHNALSTQYMALNTLMLRLTALDNKFDSTKSTAWQAMLTANEAMKLLANMPPSVVVPVNPPPELLRSMAIRFDHGLGVPDYYDQPLVGEGMPGAHAERMEATIRSMRQLYEEVVGLGFYRPPSSESQHEDT